MNLAARRSRWGYLFIAPWVLGFLIFTAGPMAASLVISFAKYDLYSFRFVGFENYRRLGIDPLFWKALENTVIYAAFVVPVGLAGSLGLALLLNQDVRGQRVFRTLYYMPSLVPAVASALVWLWVFDADKGPLNKILEMFGFGSIQWLQDQRFTLAAFIMMSLWGVGGGRMVIFLAGLQGIPDTYYEAAKLDGASAFRQFRHVTLPLLSPVMFFNLILGIIGSFQVFTSSYVMTGGGPNHASLFYALYLFQNFFEYFKLGKASALAWVMFCILLVLALVQAHFSRRWVHYEGGAA